MALALVVFNTLFPILGALVYVEISRPFRRRPKRQSRVYTATKASDHRDFRNGVELRRVMCAKRPLPGRRHTHGGLTMKRRWVLGETTDKEGSILPIFDAFSHTFRPTSKQLALWIERTTHVNPVRGHVCILTTGLEKYHRLIHALKSAQREVNIEYFIYRYDTVGKAIVDILVQLARQGVQVRFLRDGLGSYRSLPRGALERMVQCGIQVRTVHPLRFPWVNGEVNHRDHAKIVTIDDHTAFSGGMNIGAEYAELGPLKSWHDTHLELQGTCVVQLKQVFEETWNIGTPLGGHQPPAKDDSQRHEFAMKHRRRMSAQMAVEVAEEISANNGAQSAPWAKVNLHPHWQTALVQTLGDGPDTPAQAVRDVFFLLATQAQATLDITTPYFAPDVSLLTALTTAAGRGVRIRLLVPEHPNHSLIAWACVTFYRDICEAGVKVYLYPQGVLHSKVSVMDGEVSVVGAANYDLRSFRENYEVCQIFYGSGVAKTLTKRFDEDAAQSRLLRLSQLDNLPQWQKIRNSGARLIAPLL